MTTTIVIDWYPTSIFDVPKHSLNNRVGFCQDKDRAIWSGRPNMSTGVGRFYLCDDALHKWFLEIDPNYARKVSIGKKWFEDVSVSSTTDDKQDKCAFVLDFLDPKLAMMFKLRWFNES